MNLVSFLANKCFEFLLRGEEQGRGHAFPASRRAEKSTSSRPLIRPPRALAEHNFRAKCDGCRACLAGCENNILVAAGDGTPVVDFSRGACSFCGACAESCSRGAFSSGKEYPPWEIKAWISAACLAHSSVLCRTCAENCPETAIFFSRQAGILSAPVVLSQRCNGCGACCSPCPVGAIVLRQDNEYQQTGEYR
jgi:ferredoxin-type protein NapF